MENCGASPRIRGRNPANSAFLGRLALATRAVVLLSIPGVVGLRVPSLRRVSGPKSASQLHVESRGAQESLFSWPSKFDSRGFYSHTLPLLHSSSSEQRFIVRNVPGDGNCVFYAVYIDCLTSMLGSHPELDFSQLQRAARRLRYNVAELLADSTARVYIEGSRAVSARRLLEDAARREGYDPAEYLRRLTGSDPDPSKLLWGGGPEFACLSNILRRPIIVHELAEVATPTGKVTGLVEAGTFGSPLFDDPLLGLESAKPPDLDASPSRPERQSSGGAEPPSAPYLERPIRDWPIRVLIVDDPARLIPRDEAQVPCATEPCSVSVTNRHALCLFPVPDK